MGYKEAASQTAAPGLLPGGVPSVFGAGSDRFIVRGSGGRCWDQYGRGYVDFVCGYGPIIIGHSCREVNEAVAEQMGKGMIFPARSPLHEELGSVIRRLLPHAGASIFLKTGSEAVSAAIRLARAHVGRDKIIRCGFHGWHDSVVSPHVSWHRYEKPPPPSPVAGVPAAGRDPLVIAWDGEDLRQLETLFRAHGPSVAALILDPVQLREPLEENLRGVRELVSRAGALLIMDEIKTGFRINLAGAQGLYGVEADLSVFSKAIANGFPVSAVSGRADILGQSSGARIMGTYNNELLSVAAALKTISILERPGNISRLGQLGQRFIDGVDEILNRLDLSDDIRCVAYRWPSMPFIWFKSGSPAAQRIKPEFYRQVTQRGLLLLENHMNYVCTSHTDEDVDSALQSVEDAFRHCLT